MSNSLQPHEPQHARPPWTSLTSGVHPNPCPLSQYYLVYKYTVTHVVLWLLVMTLQFSSVAQLCPTLCDSVNRSTPGLPVLHQFPEFTQTHVHRVGDAIQPSHPLSSPSPALNPSLLGTTTGKPTHDKGHVEKT